MCLLSLPNPFLWYSKSCIYPYSRKSWHAVNWSPERFGKFLIWRLNDCMCAQCIQFYLVIFTNWPNSPIGQIEYITKVSHYTVYWYMRWYTCTLYMRSWPKWSVSFLYHALQFSFVKSRLWYLNLDSAGIIFAPLIGNTLMSEFQDSIMEKHHDESLLHGDQAAVCRFLHRTTIKVSLQ